MRLGRLRMRWLVAGSLFLGALAAPASAQIRIERLASFSSGAGEGAAEIVAFDPVSARAFLVNAARASVDIVDLKNPAAPTLVKSVDVSPWGASANSIDVARGIVAVAIEAKIPQDAGVVVFLNTDGTFLGQAPAGALPDMVTFTPDGTTVIVANEGEPSDDYTNDPEGSVTIIDLSGGPAAAISTHVRFTEFNAGGPRAAEVPAGVRIFGPRATVAQDLEPEYVAVSADGSTAWVTLQENNAVAIIDVARRAVIALVALGLKDYSQAGNEIDPSDRDGAIALGSWPVFGMYQPDAIAAYTHSGTPFLFTANEGDARDYKGFSEVTRVGKLRLDAGAFPNAAALQGDAALGRLNATKSLGDSDGDGDTDVVVSFGARSFSVWNGLTGQLVWDSGNDFERITAGLVPTIFNSRGDPGSFDTRSDDKGPEPEAITVGLVEGRALAFIGLERTGGFFVYDVTNPTSPVFLAYEPAGPGDIAPEGMEFVPAASSPTGKALLLVSNEVSGTLAVYAIEGPSTPPMRSCWWIDLVAAGGGAAGSAWSSDVVVRNLAPAEMKAEIIVHDSLGKIFPAWTSLAPAAQGVFPSIYETITGLREGKGSLEICSHGALAIAGRTYNSAGEATFGQYLEGMLASAGLAAGESGWLHGLRQEDKKFRTNLTFANLGPSRATLKVTLYTTTGQTLHTYNLSLAGGRVVQDLQPFAKRAGAGNLGWGFARVEVIDGGPVLASASVIDSRSNDPTTIPLRK